MKKQNNKKGLILLKEIGQNSKLNNRLQWFNVLLYVAVGVYVVLRAYYMSFTHDEALTFTIVQNDESYWGITPNHHLLNTFLMRISYSWFGMKEWALRLPNVLAYFVFGLYVLKSIRLLSGNILPLAAGIIIFCNPYFLNFFSLARGYGLSTAFVAAAMYYLLTYYIGEDNKIKRDNHLILAVIFAGLAALANLTAINFLITVLLFDWISLWLFSPQNKYKKALYFISVTSIAGGFIYFLIMRLFYLQAQAQLDFGNNTFYDFVVSIINSVISFHWFSPLYFYGILLIVLGSIVLGGMLVSMKKQYRQSNLFVITFFNLSVLTGYFLEHQLFGANYPPGRANGYVFYLLIWQVLLFLNAFSNKKVKIIFSLLLAILSVRNFNHSLNLTKAEGWEYDSHTKNVMKKIDKLSETYPQKTHISCDWLFEPAINFYIQKYKVNAFPVKRSQFVPHSEFVYVFSDTLPDTEYRLEEYFSDNEAYFFVKKNE